MDLGLLGGYPKAAWRQLSGCLVANPRAGRETWV